MPSTATSAWLGHGTIAGLGVLLLAGAMYMGSGGMSAEVLTPRSSIITNLIMLLIGGVLLGTARIRWKTATYLRRLIEIFIVFHSGSLLNDVVGLWLGRPLYQTILSSLVMQASLFALASLFFARWMAWLLLISLASLALSLLIPERYLEIVATAGLLTPLVAVTAWNRHKRQVGAVSPASQPVADGQSR